MARYRKPEMDLFGATPLLNCIVDEKSSVEHFVSYL